MRTLREFLKIAFALPVIQVIELAACASKYLAAHVTSPNWSGAPKCPKTCPLERAR
jgi:hypothetical protein